MPAVTFQIANWASAFLWASVLLMFGDGLAHSWKLISQYLGLG